MIIDIADKKSLPRSLVGGKGYALNKLAKAGFKVPRGFILTTKAFDYFIDHNSLKDELKIFEKLDTDAKRSWCIKIRRMIENGDLSKPMLFKINEYIKRSGLSNKHLILRSSVEVEDIKTSSFAGQFKSIININKRGISSGIKDIYASAFEYSVIKYCEGFRVPINKLRVAIVFQEFIPGEISGVAFVDTSRNKKIIIESVLGLNEGLVSGRITPTRIILSLNDKSINFDVIAKQKIKFVMNKYNGTEIVKTNEEISTFLDESSIRSLSQKFKDIESLFKKPQDIEWALKDDELHILQSRDITSMPRSQLHRHLSVRGNVLHGYAASAGVVSGTVSVISSPEEDVKKGSIMVAEYTNMDFINQIRLAGGIVTEEGGLLSHAAIVSRELNKPCVVGVAKATKILKKGNLVTVNGDLGVVIRGNKAHHIKIVQDKDQLEWGTLLYFRKMRTLKIKTMDVYYEVLSDKIIVYSKRHVSKNEVKYQLNSKDVKIEYGSVEKWFLYSMYLDNIKDITTKRLYENAFYEVSLFNPLKLSRLCKRYLKLSEEYVNRSKKIRAVKYMDYLNKILYLRRAYSTYILIDEYICKGHAPYALFKNVANLLDDLNLSFPEFLYRIDADLELDMHKLPVNQRNKLLKGIEYYKVLKDWHQNAFYMFSKVGAIGERYNYERNMILDNLNKNSEITRDEDFWYLKSLSKS